MEVPGTADLKEIINMCDTCVERRSVTRAVYGYCVECRLYLCEDCYQLHRDPPPSRNHRLLEGKQVPKIRLPSVDMCQIHHDEKINYFCKVHSALACQKCAFLQHRMCSDVCEVSVLSNEPNTDQKFKDLMQRITTLQSRNDANRETLFRNLTEISLNKKKAKDDIKQFCEQMHSHLYAIEQKITEEVDYIGEEDVKRMNKLTELCDSVGEELETVHAMLETNNDPSWKDRLFIVMERTNGMLQALGSTIKTLDDDKSIKQYQFKPDEQLKGVMTSVKKAGQLMMHGENPVVQASPAPVRRISKRLSTGTVHQATKRLLLETNKSINQEVSPQLASLSETESSNRQQTIKVEHFRFMDSCVTDSTDDINVRTRADQQGCRITGCTMVADDTLLAISDNENESVKLIDVRRKLLVSHIQLLEWPWDITAVRANQLAVTLPEARKIQFLDITNGNSLSLAHRIIVPGDCRGIAHTKERLYVSFDNPIQVLILNMSGKVLITISGKTDVRILFRCPLYLTVIVEMSVLCVSDWTTNTVYFFDMNGEMKAIFKDRRLKSPYGMSAAGGDTVVVCGGGSHNLFVISSDCTDRKILAEESHGVRFPDCITYSRTLSTLFVGQEKSDSLKLFKLK